MSKPDWEKHALLRTQPTTPSDLKMSRSVLRDIVTYAAATSRPTLWRGQDDISHRICPSIARDLTEPATRQANVDRRTRSTLARAELASQRWRDVVRFEVSGQMTQLAHLRHHGVPSPLLDVTPDPFIALWFATNSPERDGLLIGFNRTEHYYKDIAAEDALVKFFDGDDGAFELSAADSYGDVMGGLTGSVGVLDPPVLNDRIVVQRSRFLISRFPSDSHWFSNISDIWLPDLPKGWSRNKLDDLFDHDRTRGRVGDLPLAAIHIPRRVKGHLRGLLATHFGVDQYTIFPDVGGLPTRSIDYDD